MSFLRQTGQETHCSAKGPAFFNSLSMACSPAGRMVQGRVGRLDSTWHSEGGQQDIQSVQQGHNTPICQRTNRLASAPDVPQLSFGSLCTCTHANRLSRGWLILPAVGTMTKLFLVPMSDE